MADSEGENVSRDLMIVLRRVTEQMAAHDDVQLVLESIVQGLVNDAGAVSARLLLYLTDRECPACRQEGRDDDGPAALHDCARAGLLPPTIGRFHKIQPGTYFSGRIAQSRTPLLVNDMPTTIRQHINDRAAAAARGQPQGEMLEDLLFILDSGFASYAGYPLLSAGQLVGTLGMFFRRELSETEFDLLGTFAWQAATAVHASRMLEENQRLRERLEAENAWLQEELRTELGFDEIVGGSPVLQRVLRKARQVAQSDSTVLLVGETGTGKELLARAIHQLSPRRERPMVKVNCGAIPRELADSELFGHERGAFTGAVQRRVGRFEIADNGTLFLDEIGELPLETQVRLLRVLQEQEFERVGGQQVIRVDVRIIAATNRDLQRDVAEGRFRADLFYRINVFPLEVPPLRARPEDLGPLVSHFLQFYGRKLGRSFEGVSKASMERLRRYSWPGNVRELQNVMERACVLSPGPVVDVTDALDAPSAQGAQAIETLAAMERSHIARALEQTDGVIHGPRGAAVLLGINANTLRSRMEKLGLRNRR